MSVQSTFIPTTGCANEPTDQSVYRWRCINPGNGNLGFRAGCAEIQLDSSLNASSSWGTGCYGRVDTFYLRQLAFPSTRCRSGYFNVLDLKSDALGFLLTYAECVENFPVTYDITECPSKGYGFYEMFSVNGITGNGNFMLVVPFFLTLLSCVLQ